MVESVRYPANLRFGALLVAILTLLSCSDSTPRPVLNLDLSGELLATTDGTKSETLSRFGFTEEETPNWTGIPDGDRVVVYDDRVFFRGEIPNATIWRPVDIDADHINQASIRIRGLKAARLSFFWMRESDWPLLHTGPEFNVLGDDQWQDVKLDLAGETEWKGRIRAIGVEVLARGALLRLESLSFSHISPEQRLAAIDHENGASLAIGDEYHRARPLIKSRPLLVKQAPRRDGDSLKFMVGIPEESAHRSQKLRIVVTGQDLNASFEIPRISGWHHVEAPVTEDSWGTNSILKITLEGESEEVVFVTSPTLVPDTVLSRPNVLLITVDTLRRDFLSCYGDTVTQTPNIDRIAEGGAVFTNSTTTSNATCPSHTSIFTSLFPKDHGVTDNMHRLDSQALTLAEILREQGYATAASIGSTVLSPRVSGLDQGFDTFFDAASAKRPAAEVNADAIRWLEDVGQQPFFLWLHYYEPHTPYRPPQDILDIYYDGDPEITPQGTPPLPDEIGEHPFLSGVRDPDYPIALYRAEITSVDRSLGRLLGRMSELELDDRTLIVFTSDHGESLGEHGVYYTHEGLYYTTVMTPLIILDPQRPDHAQIDDTVSSIDIGPTILSALGLAPPPGMRGIAHSLNDSSPANNNRAVFFQHTRGVTVGMRLGKFHGIAHTSRDHSDVEGDVEIYDLTLDQNMHNNIAADHPDLEEKFRKRLQSWLRDRRELNSVRATLSSQQKKLLEELGYTGG